MSRFSEACHRPFANGTEGEAWVSKWCEFCVHDHKATHTEEDWSEGCSLIADAYGRDDQWGGGEAWLPEPDDGRFFLPSRLVCLRFEACHKGTCKGDPGADERAERVAEVVAFWKTAC